REHPNFILEMLAIEFGIKSNTVHDILAEKEIWLALDKNSPLANSKHCRTVSYGEILKVKAQEFADRIEINDFKVSPGWITNFKKHHNLSQFARQGKGQKKTKDCIILIFTVSATGEKLKPLLIHKYQNPRPLYGIDKDTLAYDNTIAQSQSLLTTPQINIREAIEFIGIAWNQVTTETITHAWQKMGILPNSITVVETEESVNLSMNAELIELVNQFSVDTQDIRMEMAEFVNLKNSVSVHDMLTTESIIAIIEGEELSELEDFPIAKFISHKLAL
ncbi:8865_t:CDS:2, partial [Ambispora gerdemannii]